MPYSWHSVCSSQLPERTQDKQDRLWVDKIICSVVLRALRTRSVLVNTSIPSLTGNTQAVASARPPLTSTTQMRQAPISLISFI